MMNKNDTDSILDGVLNRIVGLSKNTIGHDAYDEMIFNRMYEQSERTRYIDNVAREPFIVKGKNAKHTNTTDAKEYTVSIAKGKEEYRYPFIHELQQDIFYSFYKYNPKFLEDEKIQPEFRVHKDMIQKAQKNENWRKMRNMTKLDEVNSIIATTYFSEELLKEMTKRDKKFKKQMEELNEKRQQLIELMKNYANANKKEKKQLAVQMEKLMQDIQQQTEHAKKNISQISLSQAIKSATKKMAEYHETTNALMWGNETMQMQRVNPEERIALANYLMSNEKLFKLVNELGKLKNVFVETKRREIKHGTSEVYSIETGKNLSKILPTETMKMRHPVLKKDFYKRFLEGNLLEYSLRSKEKMGKGDIIVCLDVSGSMGLTLYNNITREMYGKALALAMLEMAVRDDRKYRLILFEATVKSIYDFNKKNKPTVTDIIRIAEAHYGGGTNFEAPLKVALEDANENADIVFITDGECRVGNEFLEKFNSIKKKLNFKVVSLQVGDAPTDYLEEFSDYVINFTNFMETSKFVFSKVMEGGE